MKFTDEDYYSFLKLDSSCTDLELSSRINVLSVTHREDKNVVTFLQHIRRHFFSNQEEDSEDQEDQEELEYQEEQEEQEDQEEQEEQEEPFTTIRNNSNNDSDSDSNSDSNNDSDSNDSDSDSDSDNRTITAWFGREGGFVCSVQSFFSQKPAIESIQLLENSKLWVISHADWEHMLAEFPELNLHFRKIYQYYLTIYDARIYLLREKNPKKQYESFLKFYPKLGNRVKIRYIAQYLNMHSVTLSNVRKSLIHNE